MDSQSVSFRGRVSQHSDQGYASRAGSRFTRPASTRSSTPQDSNEDQLFRDACTSPVPVSPLFTIRDPLFLRYETERRFKQNRIPWRCLRSVRFIGQEMNFEEFLYKFGIADPFSMPHEMNALFDNPNFIWIRKDDENLLDEDMIFGSIDDFNKFVGIRRLGYEEYYREEERKKSVEREKLKRERAVEEERRRQISQEKEKELRQQQNWYQQRNASRSSFSNPTASTGSSSRKPAGAWNVSPHSLQGFFRFDNSLSGAPVDRKKYGKNIKLKLKLMITISLNPDGIKMRNIPNSYEFCWGEKFVLGRTHPTQPHTKLESFINSYAPSQLAVFDRSARENHIGKDESTDKMYVGLELHRRMRPRFFEAAVCRSEELKKKTRTEVTDRNKAIRDVLIILDQCVELFRSGFYVDDVDLMMRTIFDWDVMTSKVLGMGITSRCIVESVLSMRRQYSNILYNDIVAVLSDRRLGEEERYSSANRHPKLKKFFEMNNELDADLIQNALEIASQKGLNIIPENEIGAVYFRFTRRVLYATTEKVLDFIRKNMSESVGIREYVFPVQNLEKKATVGVYLLSRSTLIEFCDEKNYPESDWKARQGQIVQITSFNHLARKKTSQIDISEHLQVFVTLAENLDLVYDLEARIEERVQKKKFKICDSDLIVAGMPVLAKFQGAHWSRAEVRGWSKENSTKVAVIYVDYGTIEEVPLCNIIEIEETEMNEFPKLAKSYLLAPAKEGGFDMKAINWLKNLSEDYPEFWVDSATLKTIWLKHCKTEYDIEDVIERYSCNSYLPDLPLFEPVAKEPETGVRGAQVTRLLSLGKFVTICSMVCRSTEFPDLEDIELNYVKDSSGMFVSNHVLMRIKRHCSDEYKQLYEQIGVRSFTDFGNFTQRPIPVSYIPDERQKIKSLLKERDETLFLLSVDEIVAEAKRTNSPHFATCLKKIQRYEFSQCITKKTNHLDIDDDENDNIEFPQEWL